MVVCDGRVGVGVVVGNIGDGGGAFIGPTRNTALVSCSGSPLKHVGGACCQEVPSLGRLCDTFGSLSFMSVPQQLLCNTS